MRKLRASTRKPIVCKPLWPNAGVQHWYNQQLDAAINQSSGELLHGLASVWAITPPLFARDEAIEADAAGVLFYCGNHVLLVHRTDGQGWAFPGGSVEPNETAEAAARREVFEETLHPCGGLLELIGITKFAGDKRFATFECEVPETFKPTLNHEHDEHTWMLPSDAMDLLGLHPGVRKTLDRWGSCAMAQDAPSSTKQLQVLLAKWGKQTIARFDLMSRTLALGFASRNMMATQIGMTSQLKDAGFTVKFDPTPKSLEALSAVTAENVALIKSIPRKWHEAVEQKVWNAVRNGSDLHTLSQELVKTHGSTVKRAALIARDQNAKAKATIERVRQMELGISRGIWMHSHAGKEPRPTHVEMNDKPYSLSQGMWDKDENEYVHPGQLINCRCTMRPIIDGAEEYADDADEPSNIQVAAALRNAEKFVGKARGAEMRSELQAIFETRKRWVGVDELALRADIMNFLNDEA